MHFLANAIEANLFRKSRAILLELRDALLHVRMSRRFSTGSSEGFVRQRSSDASTIRPARNRLNRRSLPARSDRPARSGIQIRDIPKSPVVVTGPLCVLKTLSELKT